jgi:methylthioribose-1-phosphate isomerase
MPVTTIQWADNKIRMIDQTRLPAELVHLEIEDIDTLAEAIRALRVRGAPALGVAGAYGVVLGIRDFEGTHSQFYTKLQAIADFLKGTRPTAVNLAWAIDRVLETARANEHLPTAEIRNLLLAEAHKIRDEDRQTCRQLSAHGAELIADGANVLTHCNTGALATADFGTAVGVLFKANEQGKKIHVYVDETRPLLQGARLNTWELMNEGIESTLICDNTAAFLMQQGKIDCAIVGADRIAANGDTANKIGTYNVAVLAEKHKIPFYVAAPCSTIDFKLSSGAEIPIEERDASEVTEGFGRRTAPAGVKVYSPAFDVTPADLITAIITEKGVIRPPYLQNLRK